MQILLTTLYSYTALTNLGLGGSTSYYGLTRVASSFVGYAPDVVCIDYLPNEGTTYDDFYSRSEEAMVRRIRTLLPNTRIVFLAFGRVANIAIDDATNTLQTQHDRWKAICAAYGIPFVSFADELYRLVNTLSGTLSDYLNDTVHPSETGHALAASLVETTLMTDYGSGSLPAMPSRIYDCADFEATPVFRNGTNNDGETGTWATSGNARTSSTANSTIKWSGTFVSCGYMKLVTSTGTVAISVDSGAEVTHDLSVRNVANDYPIVLANAVHEVVFRVVSGTVAIEQFVSV